ncbi:MAG: CheR family methyltransferase [Vibrionaceae bacterium]
MRLSVSEYKKFCDFLQLSSGLVLGDNKQYFVTSRLAPLVKRLNFDSMSALINAVLANPNGDIAALVMDAMTTNETLWFRDSYPFDILTNSILPELLAANKKGVRIWSAATASGQEPYSIAMVAQEFIAKKAQPDLWVKVVATDISRTMLDLCRAGVYDNIALSRGLPSEFKRKYFVKLDDEIYKINSTIMDMVSFQQRNLLDDFTLLGKFDVIFCRNVLIYFSQEDKLKVLNRMANCLNPNGYLFLGGSEFLPGLSDKFKMIQNSNGIVYKLI